MLVLSRKRGQAIVIGQGITVTVLAVQGSRVKLGFTGPADVAIHREEIQRKVEDCRPVLEMAQYATMCGSECSL